MKSRVRMSIAAAVVIMVVLVAGSGFGDSGGNAFEEWGIPETPPDDPFRYFGYLSGAGLDEIFSAVAGDVRYEPYRGIMRGAIGTARAGSGNSADQAMLLAAMLRARGYQVRFVRGELEGRNAEILLRGMYPARPPSTGDLGSGIEAFEPLLDSELKDIAKDHMWVELFQGESWLPLDPSFPRAKPGEAYASAVSHFDQPPPELFQRIIITMWERTEDADSRKLGVVEGNAAELGSATISLSVRRIPQAAAGDDGGPSSGTVEKLGGLGGALGGGSKSRPSPEDETAPPEIVGVKLRRCFIVDGERREIGSTLALEEDGADFIRREWLEFEFSAPGSELRIIERTLYPAGREAASGGPPEDRTYSINIIPGPVPLGWVRSEAARVRSSLDLPAMQERMERLAENTGDQADEAALEIGSMGEALGTAAGRLIALQFAAGSDALTRKTAEAHGIIPAWAVPRVVISSVETIERGEDDFETTVSLDLRLNEVEAYPYPGFAAGIGPLFRLAKGLQDTALEAEITERATGRGDPANVFPLMARAHADGVPVYVLTPEDSSAAGRLKDLPENCRGLIEGALSQGRHIIIPERPVLSSGAERWGWWDFNPETGDVIGVMGSGEHQAMTEYKLSLERVGLNDKTGYVIGAMVGSTATLFTVSALILEYGGTTPEMMAAVKEHLKSVLCSSCFTGAGAGASSQVSISANAGCLDWEKNIGGQVGASVSVNFCEQYKKGFECASGMLLSAMQGQGVSAGASIGAETGVSASIGCDDP